jgi:hypothetical protein
MLYIVFLYLGRRNDTVCQPGLAVHMNCFFPFLIQFVTLNGINQRGEYNNKH